MQMRAPVFRSPSPMQNPCSSSPFFLSLSKNYSKTMMIEGKMGVYWGPLYVQIHGKYKDKTKQKPPEVEEAREGKPHNRVKQPPPRLWGSPRSDCGCHHGPWWPLVVVGRFRCSAAFWCPSVLRFGPRVFAFLGVLWASSCYHLLILMAHTSLA